MAQNFSTQIINFQRENSKMSGNSGSHDANWKPPPKDHPGLKRMQSITIQSYKPK